MTTADTPMPDTNDDPLEARSLARRSNRLDPVYLFLDVVVFERLFRPLKRNDPGSYEQLTLADIDFLIENLKKHRLILWINLLLTVYLSAGGLDAIFRSGDQGIVVTGLLAPAVITGAAWYAVSFGGIPEKFIGTALILTTLMFLSFSLSMTLLTALLCKLTPWPVGLFILIPVYAALYIASLLYDNLDGLKIGLDSTLLKFSRASLAYYQKHGYVIGSETGSDVYEGAEAYVPTFTHYLTMLDKNLAQLSDREQPLPVANNLIAAATDLLFSIINMALPEGAQVDVGNRDIYNRYLKEAPGLSQDEVDSATIHYLEVSIHAVEGILGPVAATQLKDVRANLIEFEALRLGWKQAQPDDNDSKMKEKQQLADHLFVQAFQQLLSLVSAHRHILFRARARLAA